MLAQMHKRMRTSKQARAKMRTMGRRHGHAHARRTCGDCDEASQRPPWWRHKRKRTLSKRFGSAPARTHFWSSVVPAPQLPSNELAICGTDTPRSQSTSRCGLGRRNLATIVLRTVAAGLPSARGFGFRMRQVAMVASQGRWQRPEWEPGGELKAQIEHTRPRPPGGGTRRHLNPPTQRAVANPSGGSFRPRAGSGHFASAASRCGRRYRRAAVSHHLFLLRRRWTRQQRNNRNRCAAHALRARGGPCRHSRRN